MEELNGVWRTVGGRRIFIKDGQDLAIAMRESGKFDNKSPNKYKKLTDEEINKFQKSSDECYNKLNSDEKEAMYEYALGGYQDVNDYLNGKFGGYENTQDMIEKIDSSMDKYNLEEDVVTYRGTSSDNYNNYDVGDVIEEKMYYSTSLSQGIAQTFADDCSNSIMAEIHVPRGTKSIYIGDNTDYDFEAELLLSRGLSYKVIKKEKDNIVLEVVDGKRKEK